MEVGVVRKAPVLKPAFGPKVLQREPQIAAVYGYVVGCESNGCGVTLEVSGTTGYTVPAAVTALPGRNYSHWKAMLKPSPPGGNFTLRISCAGCGPSNASSISDVTFGDVSREPSSWSGQTQYKTTAGEGTVLTRLIRIGGRFNLIISSHSQSAHNISHCSRTHV